MNQKGRIYNKYTLQNEQGKDKNRNRYLLKITEIKISLHINLNIEHRIPRRTDYSGVALEDE